MLTQSKSNLKSERQIQNLEVNWVGYSSFKFHFSLCITLQELAMSSIHLSSFNSQIARFRPKLDEIYEVSKLRISPLSLLCSKLVYAWLRFDLLEMHVPSSYSLWVCFYGCLVTWVIVNLSFFFLFFPSFFNEQSFNCMLLMVI